ncbi:dicarboxylate transporter/tellurite-resistance protein TehA [Aquabacter sp. CN5-332]|uniref:dicarboxylate transporter/tellurite-resistance protein TehA n=1 Tax=Aquabacter sp. CN5-332 TaxID=3156608 RepID=UPI0032B5BB6E
MGWHAPVFSRSQSLRRRRQAMDAMLSEPLSTGKPPLRLSEIAGNMPASYFGIVLGLAGLGNAWRAAAQAWQFPAFIAEMIYGVAGIVWATLVALYLSKAFLAPEKLAAEAAHPVQCCFIGLAGVSTMLIAGGLATHWQVGADIVFLIGAAFTLCFGIWRTGGLWHGERDAGTTTAVLYLPTVAGSFVSATVISALGHPDWGQLVFGAGLFSWLAMESVLLNRLLTGPTTPIALRPTLGIQLAPAPVGAVAYIAVSGGTPDVFVHALVGYGVLQLFILARLSPWIAEAGAVPGLWAFSFGATAIATAPLRLIAAGDHGAVSILGPFLFVLANLVISGLSIMTLLLLARGKMFAAPVQPKA